MGTIDMKGENKMEDQKNDLQNFEYTYKKKKREKGKVSVILALVLSLIGGAVGGSLGYFAAAENFKYKYQVSEQNIQSAAAKDESKKIVVNTSTSPVSAVAKKAMPSIVGITTTMIEEKDTMFFGRVTQEIPATGSGIILNKEGYILTNAHVVNDGKVTDCKVMLDDGTYVDGKVVWTDRTLDVAIVKVKTDHELVPASLGDSDKISIGDLAVAIGNPIDPAFQRSVTSGVISGLNRVVGQVSGGGYMTGLIQTDAAINGGNSGGALLNANGEVIGMNTVKVSTAEGLGFSIPINSIKPIIKEVLETGTYKPPVLGIDQYDVEDAQRFMRKDLGAEKGVLVINVYKDSPAHKGGIKPGDIITKAGDVDVVNTDSLKTAVYKAKIGDTMKFKVIRDGKEVELEIKFEEYQISKDQDKDQVFTIK